jgi:hypothetical protein
VLFRSGEQSVEASLGYIANPIPTDDAKMRSEMSLARQAI